MISWVSGVSTDSLLQSKLLWILPHAAANATTDVDAADSIDAADDSTDTDPGDMTGAATDDTAGHKKIQ